MAGDRTEIIVQRRGDGLLPSRRTAGPREPANARLMRLIGEALPDSFPPVSQLGFEVALEAMAPATIEATAADLACYASWCLETRRQPLPAQPEDLVLYLRHLEAIGRKPSVLARRMATLASVHRLIGLG